jgi:hypothetical protein
MELEDLKRLALAARQFDVTVGPEDAPRYISLRLPTQHEVVLATRRAGLHRMADDMAAHVVLQRALLVSSVIAWSRVTVGDVLPGSAQADELLVYEAGAVELLLDAKPDWEEELGAELLNRLVQRRAVQDTAAKNSGS